MADPWVSLLIGGTILLVGFAAYLAFQRYHVPDFLVLIVLGAILGQLPIAPFGPGLLPSLASLLPLFLQLTIAFILFEGGLSLKLRQAGRAHLRCGPRGTERLDGLELRDPDASE